MAAEPFLGDQARQFAEESQVSRVARHDSARRRTDWGDSIRSLVAKLRSALFAGIGLFFLAGIYRTTERMLAISRRSEGEPHLGDRAAHTLPEPTLENSDVVNEAIGSLKPWVADEVLLTEENAKQCCAVLLDSVASRARRATSSTQFLQRLDASEGDRT